MGDPMRTARCSLSIYDPCHLSGRIVIDSMPLFGTKRTSGDVRYLVANGGKADMTIVQSDFRVWHETDMPTVLRDVRLQGQSGNHMLA